MDRKTFDEINDLETHWERFPPEHEMLQIVAIGLGWNPREVGPSASDLTPMTEAEALAFEQLVNGGG